MVFDLGIGMILEFFQSEGKIPVKREELKIRERGSEILGAVLLSMREEILSGPEAVSVNRNTRNETANFVWVAEKTWRVVL